MRADRKRSPVAPLPVRLEEPAIDIDAACDDEPRDGKDQTVASGNGR
ncbi:MAG TPA: hypothetical protein VF701_01780 [Thermoanaerobaculia bacterium]